MRDNSLKDLVLGGVVGGQSMVFESKKLLIKKSFSLCLLDVGFLCDRYDT